MTRFISGLTAVLCVAFAASIINSAQIARIPGTNLADHAVFFLLVFTALGLGAIVFEIGKMVGPQKERT